MPAQCHKQTKGTRAENGLDVTHAYALVPQLETGKINCVRLSHYGRLPLGACQFINALNCCWFSSARD
jgi:hypothetical protein